jgi:hypothetical protein
MICSSRASREVSENVIECRLHETPDLKVPDGDDPLQEGLQFGGVDDGSRPVAVAVHAVHIARVVGVETQELVALARTREHRRHVVDVQLRIQATVADRRLVPPLELDGTIVTCATGG